MKILLVGINKDYEKKLQCMLNHVKCDLVCNCRETAPLFLDEHNPDVVILGCKEFFSNANIPDWGNKIVTFVDDSEKNTEVNLIKSIFLRFSGVEVLKKFYINMNLSDSMLLNGQFVIAKERSDGSLIFFLVDFSGQSISPVNGFIPIFSVFHSFINLDSSLPFILPKINSKLFEMLPSGVFCRAYACEIDLKNKTMLSWGGGMEESYLLKSNGLVQKLVKNANMPLGIMNNCFDRELEMMSFSDKDSLYVFSNDIYKFQSSENDIFFINYLPTLLKNNVFNANLFDTILEKSQSYLDNAVADAYPTLAAIELKLCSKEKETVLPSKDQTSDSQEWQFLLELNPNTMLNFDPLSLLMNVVACFPELYTQKSHLYSILSELYCNALDHGLLKLDADLKTTHEGFIEYYLQRQRSLKKLEEGFIRIAIRHETLDGGGRLSIFIEDSGAGFDYASHSHVASHGYTLSGRGIAMVRSLCQSMEYLDKGNKVLAVYQW